MGDLRVAIITGLSGSGKSTALRALEDIGFFCVDNLPPALLGTFVDLCLSSAEEILRVALVMDVREGALLDQAPAAVLELRRHGHEIEICYLEAADEALSQRFSTTRRRHPLAGLGTVFDGHLITEVAKRRDVIDSNFLLVPDVSQRLDDLSVVYISTYESPLILAADRYHFQYVLFSVNARMTRLRKASVSTAINASIRAPPG